MLPDALFFEAAKEAFDEAVLFERAGRDELLPQFAQEFFVGLATALTRPPAQRRVLKLGRRRVSVSGNAHG
jgi:hypothetical protein